MSILNKKGRPFRDEKRNLGKLYNWFIKPLMNTAPEHINELVWLEWLADTKTRLLQRFKATRPFKLSGLFLETPNAKMQGRGTRDVSEGEELFVRSEPVLGRFHVSYFGGSGNEEQTFELTQEEWESIDRYLTEVEDPCNHYHST